MSVDFNHPFMNPEKSLYWRYLKMGATGANKRESKKTFILITGVTLSFLGLLYTLNQVISVTQSPPPASQVLGVIDESSSPVIPPTNPPPSPTPVVSTPTPSQNQGSLINRIKLSSLPAAANLDKSVFLADLIIDALKLPLDVGKPFPISRLVYDTSLYPQPNEAYLDPFNHEYFLVLANKMNLPTEAQSGYLNLSLEPVPETLMPYLMDSTYCQSDADCYLRTSQCQENAFNLYDVYLEGAVCRSSIPSISPVPVYSAVYGCYQIRTPSTPTCVANQCRLNWDQACI